MLRTKKKFIIRIGLACFFILSGVIYSCQDKNKKETILQGEATILVDKNIFPITEDMQAVFESQYPGKVSLDSLPETEIINSLLSDKAKLAILSRRLSPNETKFFEQKNIVARVTPFAKDAIVFILHKSITDTIVDIDDVINLMKGKPSPLKKLVFDDPNSSVLRYLDSLAGVKRGSEMNVYSLKSHADVLKYISKNTDAVGVVGLNPLVQPYPKWEADQQQVKIAAVKYVKNIKGGNMAYKPNQSNIAEGLYPLTRTLYMLNYQGSAGLGMGFASYIAGEDGQRIVLKSGLMPIRLPGRALNIRKEITTNK